MLENMVTEQILEKEGRLPDAIIACVGGGSNAIGSFHHFIKEKNVKINELSNNKCIQYEVRYFTIGRVTLYLMLVIFDDNYESIYGQWINICNQTDRRNLLGLNLQIIFILFYFLRGIQLNMYRALKIHLRTG